MKKAKKAGEWAGVMHEALAEIYLEIQRCGHLAFLRCPRQVGCGLAH
jgi:hypothetical protein